MVPARERLIHAVSILLTVQAASGTCCLWIVVTWLRAVPEYLQGPQQETHLDQERLDV